MSEGGDRRSVPVLLALGSNLGDRRRYLEEGVAFLRRRIRIQALSRVVESAPWGPVSQPPFLNLLLRAETRLRPLELLDRLQAAEAAAGRVRETPQGPRTLDVDLIFYGSLTMEHPRLVIPHPAWRERPFVHDLVAEVAGDMVEPVSGRPLREVAHTHGLSGSLSEVEPLESAGPVRHSGSEDQADPPVVASSVPASEGDAPC